LIVVSAYFDWHWNDPAGKSKTKYEIHSATEELFYLAGIYNSWQDKEGNKWNTYSIVTTAANETMQYIHNRKEAEGDQRMPIYIKREDEKAWLDANNNTMDFAYPNYNPPLIGF
jgi:putative SOS response-associated peptidase YedK